ncbi:hypothetical protein CHINAEXTREME_03080 [Halobiforma lacisalsi AJ5]|uniref:Uncharacterized protein n=1 Tax=Natronobacterium lacisalsi AJ5 TaxID=358396 RepID=M0LPQ2_NATLA|nr:hypothetical protein [Halobiforma lacisalsi]APW96815.1 hypothetical protein CHINAEXTREME_03080 [Halobiforma lacisalsi AJ5]EMA35088.1 hypothetical protein C445_06315 [Halobiforma lacisalsi AJ5]
MPDRRLERFLRSKLREAGEQYEQIRESTDSQLEEAREAYEVAKNARALPSDEAGRAKIICRRYAEKRAAMLDDRYRPACYEDGHPDCEGCVEDVHEGRIETW